MKRNFAVLLGASLAAAVPAHAQVPLTPRALGTAGAYLGVARGHESVYLNPANLGLPGRPLWSVGLPNVAVGSTVLGPEVGDLSDFFNYDDLDESRKQELLAEIPAGGTALEADLRAPLLTLQVGGMGLGVAYALAGEHTVGRDLVDLFFNGYDPNRFDYRVGNTAGTRASFWDFAAGYGRSVGPVSVGATAHYYLGRSLVQTRGFEPRYNPLLRDIEVDYVGVRSEGGSGFGVDVGVAAEPVPGLTVSAAIANALHSMSWDEELVGRRLTLNRADFESQEFQGIRDAYENSDQALGSTPTGQFATVAEGLFENAELPTTLRLGAAWAFPSRTTITGAFNSNLTDGRLAGRWEKLVGVGVQQGLPFATLRAGYSTDMDAGSLLSGGVTLGPLDLGIARFDNGEVDGASRNGWVASFGLSVRDMGFRRR